MKKKVNFFAVIISALIILALIFPQFNRKKQQEKLSKDIIEINSKIKKEKEINEKLKEDIDGIKEVNNIEKISRNNLNMGKKGEKKYIFIEDKE